MRDQNVKNVWGLRPFTLVLRNLGPRPRSGHNYCAVLVLFIIRNAPGDGQLHPCTLGSHGMKLNVCVPPEEARVELLAQDDVGIGTVAWTAQNK